MNALKNLYEEVRADVIALADPLIEQSQKILQARGDFLPQAAVLTSEGGVTLVGAMTGSRNGVANTEQVLAMLHNGLRQMAREKVLSAIGIVENAAVRRDGQPMRVIHVLVEHERGLTVAMMLPYLRNEDGTYAYGEPFVLPSEPQLKVWPAAT
jgi:hypothetical protein